MRACVRACVRACLCALAWMFVYACLSLHSNLFPTAVCVTHIPVLLGKGSVRMAVCFVLAGDVITYILTLHRVIYGNTNVRMYERMYLV